MNTRNNRIIGAQESGYSNGVLLGNWNEERQKFHKGPPGYSTEVRDNYVPKPVDVKRNAKMLWDNRLKGEGEDPFFTMNEGPCYYENMTSSYTLAYETLPRGLCGPQARRYNAKTTEYIPQPDQLTNSYGNLTQFGLAEYKKKMAEEKPPSSNMMESFRPYEVKDYMQKRQVVKTRIGFTPNVMHLRDTTMALLSDGPFDLDLLEARLREHNMTYMLKI